MVGYNRRFAPLVDRARRHLEAETGPWMITCRVNAGPLAEGHWLLDPGQGGGRIVGEGCHFVDLANALIGAAPSSVYARASAERGLVREAQTVAATLSYPDGSICTLLYLAVGDPSVPKERIEMARGAASALIDDFRMAYLWRGGRRRTVRTLGRDKGHRAELRAFLDALHEGRPMPIPLEQIEAASRATFAILDSLRTGGPVLLARGGTA
jgi:predicted dehydrogenase